MSGSVLDTRGRIERISVSRLSTVLAGRVAAKKHMDKMRETVEAATGVPMAWVYSINTDEFTLVPTAEADA